MFGPLSKLVMAPSYGWLFKNIAIFGTRPKEKDNFLIGDRDVWDIARSK